MRSGIKAHTFQNNLLAQSLKLLYFFFVSNFRRVVNFVFFLCVIPPASEFYVPTFRNTLSHLHRSCVYSSALKIVEISLYEQKVQLIGLRSVTSHQMTVFILILCTILNLTDINL